MKICFFTSDFPPMVGGISRAALSAAKSVAHHPDVEHVQVVALKNPRAEEKAVDSKCNVVRDAQKNTLEFAARTVHYCFRFRSYGVFHALNVFPVGFFVLLVCKYILRKPVVVSFYGADVLLKGASRKTKWAIRFTLKHASCALAFSNATKERIAAHLNVNPERFRVAYYPFVGEAPSDAQKKEGLELRRRLGIADGDAVLLSVGNLHRYKGGEYLIRAVSEINDVPVKLIFVGDGPDRKHLEGRVRESAAAGKVFFAGKAPDAVPYYLAADIFSMPSYFNPETGNVEGLGIVFLEAQFYGLPVVGTQSGGIPEALDEGKSGFLVPERDADALREKILLLARDRKLRVEMGKRGREFVRERFGAENTVKKYMETYKMLKA